MNSERESTTRVFSNHADPTEERRPLSYMAVAAFLLGLASAIALMNPMFWFLGGIGLMAAALALLRLRRAGDAMSGRGLAMAGLVLSILFVTWAPSHYYLRQWRVLQQAEEIGAQWLKFLLDGEAYKAYGAREDPATRGPLDDAYREALIADKARQADFLRFRKGKLVQALTNLNGRARVRHYGTESITRDKGVDRIRNVYAVSYLDDDNTTKTFFVRMTLERTDKPAHTDGFWRVVTFRGGVRPASGVGEE